MTKIGFGLVGCMIMLSGMLLAQQPVPTANASPGKNYRAADGSALSNKSSDEELARSLNESLADDPEFHDVTVKVKHHSATLEGMVASKDAKKRAESMASHTAGVRYVRNRLKVGDETVLSNAR